MYPWEEKEIRGFLMMRYDTFLPHDDDAWQDRALYRHQQLLCLQQGKQRLFFVLFAWLLRCMEGIVYCTVPHTPYDDVLL